MGRTIKRTVTAVISLESDGGDDVRAMNSKIHAVLHPSCDPETKVHTVRDAFDTAGVTVTDIKTTINEWNDPVGDPGFSGVIAVASAWYYSEIRAIAASLIAECAEEKPDDPNEWMTEAVDRATDDHSYVIYTARARVVVAVSSNADNYEADYGERPETDESRASWAMRADVWEHLNTRTDEWMTSRMEMRDE